MKLECEIVIKCQGGLKASISQRTKSVLENYFVAEHKATITSCICSSFPKPFLSSLVVFPVRGHISWMLGKTKMVGLCLLLRLLAEARHNNSCL